MTWNVEFKNKAAKQYRLLPTLVQCQIQALVGEMKFLGPCRFKWRNFGKLRGKSEKYHCHMKSSRPTCVVCWEVTDKKAKRIEVYYVGTHENAPY